MKVRDYAFCAFLAMLVLWQSGCSPTRHLQGNEKLLHQVSLHGVQKSDRSELKELYRQEPNFGIAFLNFYPQLEIYYFGKKFWDPQKIQARIDKVNADYQARMTKAKGDSARLMRLDERRRVRVEKLTLTKEQGNFLMRKLGEPPAIYDSAQSRKTAEQMHIYLFSEGFFNNKTHYTDEIKGRKAYVKYHLEERQPYHLDKLRLVVPDSSLENLIKSQQAASELKPGARYDEDKLTAERNRLEELLQNNGYYFFRKQFINFEVDTSFGGNTARVRTIIENPSDSSQHHKYRIKNVYFTLDAASARFGISRDTVLYNNIHFLAYRHIFRPKVLARKIRIAPGQLYSYHNTIRTQQRLTELDMFRYATINYNEVKDTSQHLLNAFIVTTPASRYQTSEVVGLNVTENTPGPFASLRLRMRNVSGSAEILELGLQGGFEGQFSRVEEQAVLEKRYGANVSISYPQLFLPFISQDFLTRLNPRTRFSIGFTNTDRPEYQRTMIDLAMQYQMRAKRYSTHTIGLVDVNLINTQNESAKFLVFLQQQSSLGRNFALSFGQTFVSAMNYTYLFNNNDLAQTRNAYYWRVFFESGGTFSQLTGDLVKRFSEELELFRYLKLEVDHRRYIPLPRQGTQFAYRLHAGAVVPYGSNTSRVVPYQEYFFAGGGASVRAWRPRRLGPGAYTPPNIDSLKIDPERPGEAILEANAEYRFPIFGYLKGAFFVDAGNVWLLPRTIVGTNDSLPGPPREAVLRTRDPKVFAESLRNIAVGTGLGFRLDFTFLIVRLDIGIRVIDPVEKGSSRFVLGKFHQAYNVGIGYPF